MRPVPSVIWRSIERSFRRGLGLVVGVLALAVIAAGCGSSATTNPGGTSTPSHTAGPVAVKHAYGTTEIAATPERVVALGWHGGDGLLALGIVPVGIEADTNGADKDGLHPWFRQALGKAGGTLPDTKVRKANWEDGYDYERILSLKPDVIIAARESTTYFTKDVYERLSQIAPTVGPVAGDKTPDWKAELRAIAPIFDAQDKAESVISGVQKTIDQARGQHPRLNGKTALWSYPPEAGKVSFLTTGYGGMNFLGLFGMTEEKKVADVGNQDGEVSMELLSGLSPDIAIVFDYEMTAMENQRFTRWAPIAIGHYLRYNDMVFDAAVSTPSVLSLPWLVEQSGFLDQLEQALDGKAVVRRASTP